MRCAACMTGTGQQLELRPDGPASIVQLGAHMQLTVGLGWQADRKLDLDASVLLLRKIKRSSPTRIPRSYSSMTTTELGVADVVYFSNPRAAGVAHQGDHIRGSGSRKTPTLSSTASRPSPLLQPPPPSPIPTRESDEETREEVLLDLTMVADEICCIAIVVNVYTVDQSFHDVSDAFLKLGSGWPLGHRLLPGPDVRSEFGAVREVARFDMGAASLRQEQEQPSGVAWGLDKDKRCNGMVLAVLSRCETGPEADYLGSGRPGQWELQAVGKGGKGRTATDKSFQQDVLRIVAQQQEQRQEKQQ